MSNVLPLDEKKKMLRRFRARFILVGALFLIGASLLTALSLAPSILILRMAQSSLENNANEVSASARDDQAKATRAQALVSALLPIALATSTPTETIAAALAVKPAGMSITSLSYSKGSIILTGVSSNRLAINTFRDRLQEDKQFKTVTIPVAALVGAQEGRFTVTLTGNF